MRYLKHIGMILAALFLLAGCTGKGEGYLAYQSCPMKVSGSVLFGEENIPLEMSIESSDSYSITFGAPSSLEGFRLEAKEGRKTLSYGELVMEAPFASEEGLFDILPSLFFLKGEDLSSAETLSVNGKSFEELHFDGGRTKVLYDPESSIPYRIDRETERGNISFRIEEISCNGR